MPVEVIGIDHIYVAVRDLARSSRFYDGVMAVLGYRRVEAPIGGDPHVHYYNRQFGFSLRPARPATPAHDPYAPGLHHFCFRARSREDIDAVYRFAVDELDARVVHPPEDGHFAPGYYSVLFEDPDGIRLEANHVPGKGLLATS